MFKIFRKNYPLTLLTLLSLCSMNSLIAEEEWCCPSTCNRLYIGGFGGITYSNSTRLIQTGTAFFTEAEGGPLAVDARGHSNKNSSGYGGIQVGYEWLERPFQFGCSNWSLTPAAELEAYFFSHKKKGFLVNPTERLDEHNFEDSFPMRLAVCLVNGVFTLNNCCWSNFSPYIGGGIGAARIHIRKARSIQIDPPEIGVNHFNSDRSDSTWTFAAQVKAGLRYNICKRIHIFGEYRFTYLDPSRFILGSTVSPGHAPTSTWNIEVKSICYNAFAFGIQFDL